MHTVRVGLRAAAVSLALALPGASASARAEVGVEEKLGKIADLDVVLRDEDGKDVRLKSLFGKPAILTLNYFACAGICTPLLQGVQKVLEEIRLEPEKDYRVVTVSFDPKDTPEIAAEKRANFLQLMSRPFPPSAWRFLTGEAPVTKRLADSVGFQYESQGRDFLHPGVIVFLSPAGKITRYIYGTSFLASDVELALREAAAGKVSASRTYQPKLSERWGFLCYSYDPAGQRYVFSVTKAVGALTVLLAAVFAGVVLARGAFRGHRETPRTRP